MQGDGRSRLSSFWVPTGGIAKEGSGKGVVLSIDQLMNINANATAQRIRMQCYLEEDSFARFYHSTLYVLAMTDC